MEKLLFHQTRKPRPPALSEGGHRKVLEEVKREQAAALAPTAPLHPRKPSEPRAITRLLQEELKPVSKEDLQKQRTAAKDGKARKNWDLVAGLGQKESTYAKRLESLYLVHAPNKISQIPAILARYRGAEQQLLSNEYAKYGRSADCVTLDKPGKDGGKNNNAGLPGIPTSLDEFRKVKEELLKSSAQLSLRQPIAPRDTGDTLKPTAPPGQVKKGTVGGQIKDMLQDWKTDKAKTPAKKGADVLPAIPPFRPSKPAGMDTTQSTTKGSSQPTHGKDPSSPAVFNMSSPTPSEYEKQLDEIELERTISAEEEAVMSEVEAAATAEKEQKEREAASKAAGKAAAEDARQRQKQAAAAMRAKREADAAAAAQKKAEGEAAAERQRQERLAAETERKQNAEAAEAARKQAEAEAARHRAEAKAEAEAKAAARAKAEAEAKAAARAKAEAEAAARAKAEAEAAAAARAKAEAEALERQAAEAAEAERQRKEAEAAAAAAAAEEEERARREAAEAAAVAAEEERQRREAAEAAEAAERLLREEQEEQARRDAAAAAAERAREEEAATAAAAAAKLQREQEEQERIRLEAERAEQARLEAQAAEEQRAREEQARKDAEAAEAEQQIVQAAEAARLKAEAEAAEAAAKKKAAEAELAKKKAAEEAAAKKKREEEAAKAKAEADALAKKKAEEDAARAKEAAAAAAEAARVKLSTAALAAAAVAALQKPVERRPASSWAPAERASARMRRLSESDTKPAVQPQPPAAPAAPTAPPVRERRTSDVGPRTARASLSVEEDEAEASSSVLQKTKKNSGTVEYIKENGKSIKVMNGVKYVRVGGGWMPMDAVEDKQSRLRANVATVMTTQNVANAFTNQAGSSKFRPNVPRPGGHTGGRLAA